MPTNPNMDYDGLVVSVSASSPSTGTYERTPNIEVEEDVFHLAVLVEIRKSEQTFRGISSPAWLWIYELLDPKYSYVVNGETRRLRIFEKTSAKLTPPPYTSKAYQRYCELSGSSPSVGEVIDLRKLFGTKCKIMVKNVRGKNPNPDGTYPIFHRIEKVSIKGLERNEQNVSMVQQNLVSSPPPSQPNPQNSTTQIQPNFQNPINQTQNNSEGDLFSNLF